MKNRKLMIFIVVLLFIACVAVTIPFATAHAEEGETAAEATAEAAETVDLNKAEYVIAFLKEKILPNAISIILSVGTIYCYLRPVLLVIKDNAKNGKSLQEKFNTYKEDSDKQLQDLTEQLQTAEHRLCEATEAMEKYKRYLDLILSECQTSKEMLSIGFGNNAELVRKGAAKMIYELAKTTMTDKKESDAA